LSSQATTFQTRWKFLPLLANTSLNTVTAPKRRMHLVNLQFLLQQCDGAWSSRYIVVRYFLLNFSRQVPSDLWLYLSAIWTTCRPVSISGIQSKIVALRKLDILPGEDQTKRPKRSYAAIAVDRTRDLDDNNFSEKCKRNDHVSYTTNIECST
jgi:hypothetical protein